MIGFGAMFYNIISVIFALLAWWIPVRAILPAHIHKGWHYVVLSLGACTVSLQVQIMKIVFALNSSSSGLEQEVFDRITYSCGAMILATFLLLAISIFVKRNQNK